MIPQPKLRPVPTEDKYELLEDYTYACTVDDKKISITVPSGFIYDGASIPPIGWIATYTNFHPDVMCAALVHDYLYAMHQTDRETADSILYQLLIECGVSKEKAEIMFQAVRIAGGSHW